MRKTHKMTVKPLLLCLCCAFILSVPARAQEDTQALLTSMTLEQKVAQMFLASLYGEHLTEVGRAFLQQWQPGGVVVFEYNVPEEDAAQSVTALINSFQQTVMDAGGLPLIIAADQEGGIIATFEQGFTPFPVPYLVAATGSSALAYQYGQSIGEELRAIGVNMNLAPVADLETNIANPIIFRRAFGSDPQLVGAAVAQVVRGMQAAGVMAVAKHFPGHGDTSEDSHVQVPTVNLGREVLASREFVPFQMTMDAGVSGVMVAHVWYAALEPQEGLPATLSHPIVSGLLRDEMGYEGLALTDAMDMDAIDVNYTAGAAAVLAVQAGIDVLALGPHMGLESQAEAIQAVIDAVRGGTISEARIDESVRRILAAKQEYGILAWQPLDPATVNERLQLDAHATVVDELFRAGVTVALDSDNLIPLTGAGSLFVYPGTRPQIERECRPYNAAANWLAVSATPSTEEMAAAQEMARRAEVTVIFTDNAYENTMQAQLVNSVESRVIVVALSSPYDALRMPNLSGYVLTYSPLPAAIPAVCGILFGAFEAQGQLPVTLSSSLPAGTGAE
jgi:beta-N-acetylhexosaminidase